MSAVRRWWALEAGDRLRLPLLMLALPLISLTLRLTGYKRTSRLIEWLSSHRAPRRAHQQDLDAALRLAQLAAIAGRRGPVQATCLRQALLVYGTLRRRGLRPELKFGVRREDDGIGAHAWVELEQRSLDVAGDPDTHQPFTL
jgi:hypothetical protein